MSNVDGFHLVLVEGPVLYLSSPGLDTGSAMFVEALTQ